MSDLSMSNSTVKSAKESMETINNSKEIANTINSNSKETTNTIISNSKESANTINDNPKESANTIISNSEETTNTINSNPKESANIINNNSKETTNTINSNSKETIISNSTESVDIINKIKVEIEKTTREVIQLKISKVDISIVNSIRRILIEEIETMCFDIVDIKNNTSTIEDQVLAHRLGQIPFISVDSDKYLHGKDCSCDKSTMCTKCSIIYTLKVKNVDKRDTRVLTTRDLIPMDESTTVIPAHTNYESKTDDESLFICNLLPGQELDFIGYVRKGIAKGHGHHKWQAVELVGLRSSTRIKIDRSKIELLTREQRRILAQQCPSGTFVFDEESGQIYINENPNPRWFNFAPGSGPEHNYLENKELNVIPENKELNVIPENKELNIIRENKELNTPEHRGLTFASDDCRMYKKTNKCVKYAQSLGYPNAISVIPRDDYYVLTVYSCGALDASEIVSRGLKIFIKKVRDWHSELAFAQEVF